MSNNQEILLEQKLIDNQSQISTFRQLRKKAGTFGTYQWRLFVMMGCYWITASFFLILPFYFFKKPIYCKNKIVDGSQQCLGDCIEQMCRIHADNIISYIKSQDTLTDKFQLFCGDSWRIFYKICPQTLSWIGLLIYGYVGDHNGRKIAFKISWRFYTIGLIFLTATQTIPLKSLGYFLSCINCFPSLMQIDRSLRLRACYLLLSFLLIGPLFASLLAGYLVQLGLRVSLMILCTVPAIILSIMTGFLEQSSIFVYRSDKLRAINIINCIAKINKQPPITLDLGQSIWLRKGALLEQVSLSQLFKNKLMRVRLFKIFFLMLTFFYNNRIAQISLDDFTDQYLRGLLMNGSSAIAVLTVIILITRFKLTRLTWISIANLVIVSLAVCLKFFSQVNYTIETTVSIFLRYLSDLSYSLFLIWTIESFPTVCRAKCMAFALIGCSIGSIIAYSLRGNQRLQFILGTILMVGALWAGLHLRLDSDHRLTDSLSLQDYDKDDKFKKF